MGILKETLKGIGAMAVGTAIGGPAGSIIALRAAAKLATHVVTAEENPKEGKKAARAIGYTLGSINAVDTVDDLLDRH